jgi:hypothetical protein
LHLPNRNYIQNYGFCAAETPFLCQMTWHCVRGTLSIMVVVIWLFCFCGGLGYYCSCLGGWRSWWLENTGSVLWLFSWLFVWYVGTLFGESKNVNDPMEARFWVNCNAFGSFVMHSLQPLARTSSTWWLLWTKFMISGTFVHTSLLT